MVCYMCEHFVGPTESEEWDEYGTDGMCPYMGWETDAFDDVCGNEKIKDGYYEF